MVGRTCQKPNSNELIAIAVRRGCRCRKSPRSAPRKMIFLGERGSQRDADERLEREVTRLRPRWLAGPRSTDASPAGRPPGRGRGRSRPPRSGRRAARGRGGPSASPCRGRTRRTGAPPDRQRRSRQVRRNVHGRRDEPVDHDVVGRGRPRRTRARSGRRTTPASVECWLLGVDIGVRHPPAKDGSLATTAKLSPRDGRTGRRILRHRPTPGRPRRPRPRRRRRSRAANRSSGRSSRSSSSSSSSSESSRSSRATPTRGRRSSR